MTQKDYRMVVKACLPPAGPYHGASTLPVPERGMIRKPGMSLKGFVLSVGEDLATHPTEEEKPK